MAKHSFLAGLATFTAAAAAVAGVCYVFRDEIRDTKTYKDLNQKYDVDTRLSKASSKAKSTAADLKEKASDLKDKAVEKAPWKTDEENLFEDDEIVLNDNTEPEQRDYVKLQDGEESAAPEDTASDKEKTDESVNSIEID